MDEDGILTVLPGSVDPVTGQLRVTAFITPRLNPGGGRLPITDFPLFADWGSVSPNIRLALEVSAPGFGNTFDLEPDPASPRPDPGLWHLLFDRVMVGDGEFQDLSSNTVASFPSAAVSELVRTLYATVAETSHNVAPPATSGPLVRLHPIGNRLLRGRDSGVTHPLDGLPDASPPPGSPPGTLGRYVDRSKLQPPTSAAGSVETISEAIRFYDRPGATDPLGPDVVPDEPEHPDRHVEFHGFVSALADYPELLRRLGLAMDFLIIGGDAIPQGFGQARFRPVDSPVEWLFKDQARPWTHYENTERRFIAVANERVQDLVDGSLRLDSEIFHVEQIDVDGAALKIASTARTVVATAEVVNASPGTDTVAPSMTPDAESLPALRGIGFTLYRDSRAEQIVNGWDKAADQDGQHSAGGIPELWAEDVTRGYRIDIAEETDPEAWRSLHARIGNYALRTDVPGERIPLPIDPPIAPDEGYVKAASASRNAAEPEVAYLHEAVAGWDGWSLAAPRPGNRIGLTAVEPPPDPATEKPGFAVPLEAVFRPQGGTLPRLRFGRSYRMRARLVDMAGRSVPTEYLVPSHVTPFSTFFRWDPVASPALIPRRPFTEGESLLRMVIRSTLGGSAADYVQLDRIIALAGHTREDLAYRAVNDRHLAAPIGSQQLAELHQLFDASVRASSSTAQRDEHFAIAARSAGTFLSPADGGMLTDGKNPPRPIVFVEDPPGHIAAHQNLQKPGEYVLHDVEQVALPYLPDPLALGASFTTLPGDPDTRIVEWPTDGTWFDRKPVLLRIEDGSAVPEWDPDQRLLRVFLPQAEHAVVQLSSVLPKDELPLMGVWMLEREPFRNVQEEDAVLGRHWLITPWSTLELVHAVEKPLAAPEIKVADPPVYNSAVHRFPGETFASLAGTIEVHAKSTGRLDIDATWTEWLDDVTRPAPEQKTDVPAHVGDFLLDADEDHCRIGRNESAPKPPKPPTPKQPATHLLRHEFGDTKHRWVDYQATATTRFREYFPPEITDPTAGLTVNVGPALRLNVPSSHRPDPPQVEYVVPTWRWEDRSATGATIAQPAELFPTTVRKRVGGGLRVYLSRPWYSSGADELLGVVVRQQPWLTLPVERDLRVGVSVEASQLANLAAERIVTAGLTTPGGPPELRPLESLLAGIEISAAPKPVELADDVSLEDAQLTAHLAVLDGVGEADEQLVVRSRNAALTGILDRIGVVEGIGGFEPVGKVLGPVGKFVTSWGSDPAWASRPTALGPYIHQFPLRSAVGTDISLPDQPEPAVIVGHTPVYDETRRMWYCDLQLDAGLAYQPFVDLVLVRYQPHSINGYHASSVVRAGFIQVVPDRTAAMTMLPGSFAVSLRGPSGYNALGQTYLFGSPDAVLVDASREVVALVQSRPVGSDDIDWRPAGAEVRLHASGPTLADIRWNATVPRPERVPDQDYRLVLSEFELFETDESQAETWITRPAGGFGESFRKAAGRRLVFATEFSI